LNGSAGFNGATSIVNCGTGLNVHSSLTISVLVKWSTVANSVIITKGNWDDGTNASYTVIYYNGILRITTFSNGYTTWGRGLVAFTPTANKWYHIVCLCDISIPAYSIYINSIKQDISTTLPVSTPATTAGSVVIGRNVGINYRFSGSLDELIIENTPWAVAKIKNQYSRIKGFF
jgi:hypothetical protein